MQMKRMAFAVLAALVGMAENLHSQGALGDLVSNAQQSFAAPVSAPPPCRVLSSCSNGWVNAVKMDPDAFKAAASKDVVDAVYRFDMKDSKDLYDYLTNVEAALAEGSAVKEAGASLKDYLKNQLVLRVAVPPSTDKAHGLAIYIPNLLHNSANYERLAISRDSMWDDFLRATMAERLK